MDGLEKGILLLDTARLIGELPPRAAVRLARAMALRGGRDEFKRLLRVFYRLNQNRRRSLLDELQQRALQPYPRDS